MDQAQLTISTSSPDLERLFLFVCDLRRGDFSARLPVEGAGRSKEIAVNLNRFCQDMASLTSEVARLADEVGVQGKLGPTADVVLPPGPWRQMVETVNLLVYNLTAQIRDLRATATCMAEGDFSRRVTVGCDGEMLALKEAMNVACDRLRGRGDIPGGVVGPPESTAGAATIGG